MKNGIVFLKNRKIYFLLLCLFIFPSLGISQVQELIKPQYGGGQREVVTNYLTTRLENGELVPWFPIQEVIITRKREFKSEEERINYLRLRRNILRVLPYAIYAQNKYDQLDRDLVLAESKKEQRRLIKTCESEIKLKFSTEVKNLTVSQGKLLIKLIERQTGNTSYELLKDLKGGLTATIYQGIAGIFGHNLKSTYDPQEDYEIENIIREFEKSRNIRKSPYQ